jgi:hypothetical protein
MDQSKAFANMRESTTRDIRGFYNTNCQIILKNGKIVEGIIYFVGNKKEFMCGIEKINIDDAVLISPNKKGLE